LDLPRTSGRDVKLSPHDLRQLDDGYLQQLPEAALRVLSSTLLADLKEAQERLQQNPSNSSRPPSSRLPWECPATAEAGVAEPDADDADDGDAAAPPGEATAPPAETRSDRDAAAPPERPKRKPGQQPGAPGVGRTTVFVAQASEVHRPAVCRGCGEPLAAPAPAPARVYTGFHSLDLRWGDAAAPGVHLQVVDHRFLEVTCGCGHHTRERPTQGAVDPTLEGVPLRAWRLVGPGLATRIIALSLRFRLSRRRIQAFLDDGLGVHLSVGTIHPTLHESAAVAAPAEATRLADIQGSGLLHADETSWPQPPQRRCLWVFLTTTTTLFVIAGRGKATVTRVLDGFGGWLMSDGWFSYRGSPQRLRCWANLLRKAQGLIEGYDADGRRFGRVVHTTLETLMAAIYAAREGPPPDAAARDLPRTHAVALAALRHACLDHLGHRHEKTKALAVEFYTDWDAIFNVLKHPQLPLTNNDAERAPRHWVIAQRLSHGTRTAVGSCVFTLLASVIETCRQRGHSPWDYLATAIADRRAGLPLPPLPQPGV
jgi:transposase